MTRTTNARLAGFTFLFYIATGITHLVLFNRATGGAGDTLASIAEHAALVRVTVVLTLLEAACALVLAVTLYALTRDVDPDLAMLALSFRVAEGVIIVMSPARMLGLLSVATAAAGTVTPDAATTDALASFLLKAGGLGTIAAICFAVASTLYSWLFLRARSIPVPLAWLGLLASALWVVLLPAQLVGSFRGPATYILWIPMAVFEVALALWLLIKGVAPPAPRRAADGVQVAGA
jgi:hypothetical protein